MDSRHPFSQTQPQTHMVHEDPRYPPIPPPPYSSQRPDLPSHNDPFFPRRQHFENNVASPNTSENPPSYGLPPPPYPPNLFVPPQSHGANDSRLRRGSYESSTIYDQLPWGDHSNRNGDIPQHDDAHRIVLISPPLAPALPSLYPPSSIKNQYALPESARRSSSNGMSALTMYGHQSPPPPPQFGHRQIPPLTSPQHVSTQYNVQPQTTRGPPSSFPFARDLPALSAAHRPGSSMSISSMLGANSEKSIREATTSSRGNGYATQPATAILLPDNHTARTSSPQSVHSSGQYMKRARTPDFHTVWRSDGSRSRAYSGGPQQRPLSGVQGVPQEILRPGPQGPSFQNQNISYQINRLNGHTDIGSRSPEMRRSSVGGMEYNGMKSHIEFPTPPNEHQTDHERRPIPPEITNTYAFAYKTTDEPIVPIIQGHPDIIRRQESGGKGSQHGLSNRSMNQSQTSMAQGVRVEHASGSAAMNYPFLSRSANNASSPNPHSRINQPLLLEHNSGVNFGLGQKVGQTGLENGQSLGPREVQLSMVDGSPHLLRQRLYSIEAVEEQQVRDSPVSYSQSRRHQYMSALDRFDQPAGISEDPHQQPRTLHGLMVDNSKRGGRISPLPQAVQGAQGRMRGPASEPGIKNEFARMFSGIGSGVGSAMSTPVPTEPGASLSIPPSPTRVEKSERRTPLNGRNGAHDQVKSKISSRGGKRSRKVKDEEPKVDAEDGDGSGAVRSFISRGPKRVRQSYNLQNLHNNLHHHHHHAESSTNAIPFPVLNITKRTFTPSQTMSITPSATPHHRPHHHHFPPPHHHHPHHHHHHTIKPPRNPVVTVNSKAVLDSVRDLPRHHLGSTLYTPTLSVPSWTASHEDVKFGYISTPRPMPRFEGKENCTITIRVPRLYLQRGEREEICFRRAVWGSEVYTDDSDPVAAAIHGGWIRGEWGEDVDVSMLEPETVDGAPNEDTAEKEASMVLSSPPVIPVDPLKGHDMHITLLILPTLQSYTGLVAHGMKSRSWNTRHDGLSFMIQRLAWVKEKASRGEERGGEARRKRMSATMDSRAKIAGPAIPTNFVARDLKKMNATAVAS